VATVRSFGIPQDEAARTGVGSADIASNSYIGVGSTFGFTFPPYSATVLALNGPQPPPATRQPDNLIKTSSESTYLGNNVYNTDGTGQTTSQNIRAGRSATFNVMIQNDGSATDSFTVQGNGNSTGFTIRYYTGSSGGTEITTAVTAGTYRVSNLGPGAVDRLGLGAEELAERYPRLITATISGYGTGGTLDHKRAYDLLAQAEAGSCAITGWPGQPAKPGIPIADVGTAMYAFSSILTALYDRERTGRGAAISVSMFDTVAEFMGYALNHARHTGHDQAPNGLSAPAVAPYGAYPTSDGQTVVLGTTNDAEWRRLAVRMLDRPELADDPRFARNADRIAHRAELDAEITAWCAARALAEIQTAADAAGIGNARYNTPTEVVDHPHQRATARGQRDGPEVGAIGSILLLH